MEALQKRHEDFENSLAAQDERLKLFSEAADRLISAKHYDSKKYDFSFGFKISNQLKNAQHSMFCSINERRNNVVKRRENVKNVSAKRKDALVASHTFQV